MLTLSAVRHKSIIAYLSANGLPNTAATLREELDLSEFDFDDAAVKKYETLLEKKWTSTVRLQKKVTPYSSTVDDTVFNRVIVVC